MPTPLISIAGRDRTAELGPALAAAAAAHEADPLHRPLPPELQAAALAGCRSEAEFEQRYFALLRRKHHMATCDFTIPRRSGPAGALLGRLKRVLWRLLVYQHDRMSFLQNMINTSLVNALDFDRQEMRREVARLEARLAALERAGEERGRAG
jgi:hypothetical protein